MVEGGIFIFNSNSVDTVSRWIETDPAVRANAGMLKFCPTSPLLVEFAPWAKYEMTTYQFIRFWPEIKKFTVAEAPQLIAQHEEYWKKQSEKNTYVTFASLGDYDGDILIAVSVDENILIDDPGMRTGLIQFEKKSFGLPKAHSAKQSRLLLSRRKQNLNRLARDNLIHD